VLAIRLRALLQFLDMAANVVHNLLLETLDSLYLVDLRLIKELEVLVHQCADDVPQRFLLVG